MKKLLLTLIGVAVIACAARAGTVYERTTLENVVQSGEKFALFASGPIRNEKTGEWSLVWLTQLTNGGSGTAAIIPYSGIYNPTKFHEAIFADVYPNRPALMTLEAAGTATVGTTERDVYYMSYTKPTIPDVTSWVGIKSQNGVFAVSNTKQTADNGYKIYIDHAVNYWTAPDGSTVSSNTPYRISSVAYNTQGAMLHYQTSRSKYNFGTTTNPAIPTTEEPQSFRFLDFYHTIPTVEQICGIGGEESYQINLGVAQSIPEPKFVLKTIKEGGEAVTPYVVDGPVTYKYEVVDGADVLSVAADGTFTGLSEGTARVSVTLSDNSANFFDIGQPYYIDVTVSNHIPMTLTRVDNPLTLAPTDVVIFVSARPFTNGKGFVAARSENSRSGVMFSEPILPGSTTLPADMTLSVSKLNELRQFCLSNAGGTTTIKMQNDIVDTSSNPPGTANRFLDGFKTYSIRYLGNTNPNYNVTNINQDGYFPNDGGYHLGFFNSVPPALNGSVITYSTQVSELCHMTDTTTLVPMYFYKLNKLESQIDVTDEIILNPDDEQTPNVNALLKSRASNGELAVVDGVTLAYTVVDAGGAAFAAGQAPIAVAADGTVSALAPGQARVKVTVTGDYARYFDPEPAYCDVIVRTPAYLFLGDAFEDMELEVYAGQSLTLSAASLKDDEENGNTFENTAFTYMLADDNYEPWYDEDGNPVIANDVLSVDPATGVVSTTKGVYGDVYLIPVMTAEAAKRYYYGGDAQSFVYHVTVLEPQEATIDYAGGNDGAYIDATNGAALPVPVVTVIGAPIEDITYKYTIVDPATGKPYADGEAPITIDEDGNIVPVPGKSGLAKLVVTLSDESALLYNVPAIEYIVSLPASTPTTATGPFATEYVRVKNLDEVKNGEGFVMVSTDARNLKLTWLTGFGGNPSFGTTDSVAVLSSPVLPEKLHTAWLGKTPFTMHLAQAPSANKYYLYFYDNGQPSYMDGTGGSLSVAASATTQYAIEEAKVSKEVHGNEGFKVYPGKNTTMFATEDGPTNLSNNNVNNIVKDDRAYPEFYRVVYEPTLFSLAAGSTADLYKLVNGTLIPVITLAEGENMIDLGAHPDAFEFFIVPTEHSSLASVTFTDGTSATDGFDSLLDYGMQGHGYKIVFGQAYASYDIETVLPEAKLAQISLSNGSKGDSVNIPAGKTGERVPTPVLTDDDDEPIEGEYTFKYTVINPKTGQAYDEGEAPITVDENGNITTVEGKTGHAQVVVSLSDKSAKLYDAEPVIYDVNVTKPNVVVGFNGEQDIDLQLDNNTTGTLPNIKLTTVNGSGEVVDVPGATYTYEVINPANGQAYAKGEAPVTVNPETGEITATDICGDAIIKVTANGYDVEPLYIDVTVKDYHYVKLQRITDLSTIKADDPVVFVSSRPISGKGFVSASSDNQSLGIETGTTGNMPPVSVLPGKTELPDELALTNEQVEALRMFSVVSNGSSYGFQIKNGVKFGTNQYIRSEKNDRIRYLNNEVIGYAMNESNGAYAPLFNNGFYLNFNASGILTSFKSSLTNTDGADIVLYGVVYPTANISFENGSTGGSVNIPAGKTGESVPTPVLTDSNDEPIAGITFKYTVINPETDEPYAEGEAPITVDENGNITTVEGKTGDARVVVTLSDASAKLYDAEPIYYDVNVTSSTVITGNNGEEEIALQLGNGTTTELPGIKVETVDPETGEMKPVENVTYVYEVINPGTGEPYAEGEAPVTVDPVTGEITATDINGEARIKVTANGYDAEPLYLDVKVKNYNYVKLQRVTDISTIKAGDAVVFVSSRTISGKGFVSASSNTEASGVETGTTGNMPPVSVMPGLTELPAELVLTNEQADALRMFSIVSEGDAYGIQLKNGVKFGTNQYIRSEKNDRIRYLNGKVVGYQPNQKSEGVYAPLFGNFYLNFNASGILTSFTSSLTNANGADIVFYSVVRQEATVGFENGSTAGSVSIPAGKTGESVPTPVLTDSDNDEPIAGVTYRYTVINPETGEEFAEGEAPITVDENGNITTVEGKTGTAQVVVTLSDASANLYDAKPAVYTVNVTSSTVITGSNGEDDINLQLGNGTTTELPGIKVETVDPETGEMIPVEGVTYRYEVINPETGAPYAEGVAPVTVDPITGEITATDINGEARIKVTVEGEYSDAEPLYIDVTVKNYSYVKLQRVTDPSTLKASDPVVFVSSRPISGKGFVSASSDTQSLGIETGTTGNMPPVAVLPGQTVLPDELVLTDEQADALRMFSIVSEDNAYGIQIKNGVKFGTNQYIRSEKNDRIRYLNGKVIGYQMTRSESAFAPQFGNFYLNFNGNGILTSFSTSQANINGADIVFYSVLREKATASFDGGTTAGSVNIPAGKAGESVPTPVLTDSNDDVIEGVTFKYTVINPETGEEFDEGEAPITVDENGNITSQVGKTGTARVMVTLSDDDATTYDAEPIYYDVNITSSTVITGNNGEEEIALQLGNGTTTELPGIKVETGDPETGEMKPVEGVTYRYEVINPETGDAYADGEAPVTVDENGNITAGDINGAARIKVTIEGEYSDAEPLYIDVTVKNYSYVKLQRVTDPSTLLPGDPVVFVSARAISGKGFVSASSDTEASGIETGTTGNMPPVSVMPGLTELPAELVLTDEQADALRLFSIVSNDNGYGFQIKNGVKFGTGQYIRSEKNDRIRYLNNEVIGYELTPKSEGVYAPQFGNFYLNFNAKGILTSFTSTLNNANGADIVFYSVVRPKATVNFEDGETTGSVNIPAGKTDESVPTPVLTDSEGQPVENVTFAYTVIDPATGQPFAEGDAPVTVDENGNITTVEGKTGAAQVVVSLSDEDSNMYDAEPAVYTVNVTTPALITPDNGYTGVRVANGATVDLPVPVLKTVVDGEEVEVPGVTFSYELIDPLTGEPFDEGEAPVIFDPETGKVTAVKEGDAQIKVTITGEKADEYSAEPLIYDVTVTEPAEIYVSYRKVNSVEELEQLAAENAGVIVVSARTFDDMGFVAATKATDANNNFLPVSILEGETELPAEFNISSKDADALLSVYAVKQGENFGFKLPAGHYLKRTINNKIILTTAFHGYKVSAHNAAKAKGRAAAAQTNDGFRLMTNNNYLGFVANGNLSHQNNGNIFTNGAAPAFYTINKVKAEVSFADGETTLPETLQKGETATIPAVTMTAEQDGQTVTVDGVKYKYEVVDSEGNPVPAATSPISIDPETGAITAVKGGDARVKITPADNAEMIYDAEPVYVDITVPASDAKLVADGKDTGSITISEKDTEKPVIVPWPTLVDANNEDIDAGWLTYGYEGVDANGNPFPEGQAPITVNDEGQITVKPGAEGQAYVRVTLTGEAAEKYPDAEPYVYEVNVERKTTGPVITIGDDDERTLLIDNGTASASIPTPELTVDGVREDATFTYTVVDEQGKPFAEGEAPIVVDPETGTIIVIKPGIAQVVVSLSEESAEHLGVDPEPVTIDVQVLDKQTSIMDVEAAQADDATYFNLDGVRVENPGTGHYIRVSGNKAMKVLIK